MIKKIPFWFVLVLVMHVSCSVANADEEVERRGWEIDVFDGENEIPHSGIYLENEKCYLVLGQKFTKTDSGEHTVALVRLSDSGHIEKTAFFGYEYQRVNNIQKLNNRIFLSGHDRGRLWVLEVNSQLEILFDTVFREIKSNNLFHPKIAMFEDDFILVCNFDEGVEIIRTDSNFKVRWNSKIQHPTCRETEALYFRDILLTNNKLAVSGHSHALAKHNDDDFHQYDGFFAQINLHEGKLEWFKGLTEDEGIFDANAISFLEGNYYVACTARKTWKTDTLVSDTSDAFLFCFTMEGEILWNYRYRIPGFDRIHDMAMADSMFYLVGSNRREWTNVENLMLVLDRHGNLLKQTVFGTNRGDELRAVVVSNEKDILLIGNYDSKIPYGNRWKIYCWPLESLGPFR